MPTNIENTIYPWQKNQWLNWLRVIKSERVPHAILFYGSPHIGIQNFACHVAHSLLCENTDIESKPCGVCRACHLASVGTHRDYLVVEAEKDTIKMEQVLDMIEFVQLARHSQQYRVVFIPEASHLSYASSNALLKVLEEPPEWSLILLSTDNISSILPTIRSRCYKISFALPGEEAVAWLAQQLQCDEPQARLKLQWHNSQVMAALADSKANREAFHKDFVSYISDAISMNALVERWHKVPPKQLQNWLLKEFHYMLQLKHHLIEENATVAKLATRISHTHLEKLYRLQTARCRMADESHPNARLLLESSLLEWGKTREHTG